MSQQTASPQSPAKAIVLVVITGVVAGFLSGLFGVGGGLIIVPALMAAFNMDQRRASATSLVAIILTAGVGMLTYAMNGYVSLVAALFLVAGALVGAQIGVYLLRKLPEWSLPWIFVGFVVVIIVSQQLHVPTRDAELILDAPRALGLIAVGILSGIFAGLVGVGGGGVIVPGLELLVGVGDLLARGTSLLVMIPTAVTGSWTNIKHGLADLKIGLLVGAIAAALTPVGAAVAKSVSPATGNILFACFLLVLVVNMLAKAYAMRRAKKASEGGVGE
ncbi:sulfite exporter TauE/SafE family protein [Schaalia suimastitidis]|uniref:sulfite exporter TauE/SafE family protein n=1 Tax=Schaalia suimastitidis TaxID=121163 RepID=UPI000425756D|nr:sulfite exporter TauE/SafE family protein [Schaalia suimastitidis]